MTDPHIRSCLRNLQLERDNEALYQRLSEVAGDTRAAGVYRRIAREEGENARFWERCLQSHGTDAPAYRPRLRVRLLGRLARWFGTAFVMPTVVRLEHADQKPTPVDRESHRDHFTSTNLRVTQHPRVEAGGNTLRASVLGANDGLVSNASLVMGMAGAAAGQQAVVLAGLAGLVAGACSMALGEWLSVNSSREFYQARITERAERLAVAPDEAKRHIAAIYRDKGWSPERAEHLAEHLTENPRTALDTMVREDLGVDPAELGGSAWRAAISSFALFAFGALFPVLPYLFTSGHRALYISLASTFLGLTLIATGTSLFTGRPLGFSIIRQAAITAVAVAVTYGVGSVLGRIVGGI